MRVAITANRNLTRRDEATIGARCRELCALSPDEVIVGGARGGDTVALVAVARYRGPATALVVVVPGTLAEQPREAQEAVRLWCSLGRDVVIELGLTITAADGFEAFKVRNRVMVDRGTHALGFWNGDRRSGTYSALAYAARLGRPLWVEALEGGDR
jgi:pimeloyl-ACP methyl ester carboxylesterase